MKKYCFVLGMLLATIPSFARTPLKTFVCPSDQIVLTTSSTGTFDNPENVEMLIKVLNAGADLDRLTFTPPLDSAFPLGETRITCTATDRFGDYGVVTFTVTVQPASVDYSHPDLYLVIWINQSEIPQLVPLDAIIMPGKLYQLQFALTADGEWQDLGAPFVGTGQRLAYNDDISPLLMNAPQAFLRVKLYDMDMDPDSVTAREESVIGIYDLVAEPDPIASGWGNDWLVGGTGRDARGGTGDDILIGVRTGFEDTDRQTGRGGAGRDVLIGGAGSDR